MQPQSTTQKSDRATRPAYKDGARELVSIPNARALSETAKAIRCDFGDDADHWLPKSQIAAQSEVKRRGDAGALVIPRWLAEQAHLLQYIEPRSGWERLRNFRHRLQELHALLAPSDPARAIIKTLCDALREDLGIEKGAVTPATGAGAGRNGGGGRGGESADRK